MKDDTHEEWLQKMREWASKQTDSVTLLTTCGGPIPNGTNAFRSIEESRSVLEPYGMEMTYNANGRSSDGGKTWYGVWSIHHTKEKAKAIFAAMDARAAA